MRPLLNSAIQSSARTKPKPTKKQPPPPPSPKQKPSAPSEFLKQKTSAPRRLNDIVQAPPQIDKLPRGAARAQKKREEAGEVNGDGVVSMKQKLMMEKEREDAIRRYRELKEMRLKGGAALVRQSVPCLFSGLTISSYRIKISLDSGSASG
jgi:hypothetical protein